MLKIVAQQISDKNIKRDVDVTDLYLGEHDIAEVENLGRFRNLRRLWLHNNKLRALSIPRQPDISFLLTNFRLAELYLQDNDIKSVAGMLRYLRCLQVLMLQNNQLEDLEQTIQEIMPMQALRVLNIFHNPLSQVKGYRPHVIYHVPSVYLLDRQVITNKERAVGRQIYEERQEAVKATVAFGRRSEGPPTLYHRGTTGGDRSPLVPDSDVADNYRKGKRALSLEDAISARNLRRSVMQYTTMDWSLAPTGEQIRVGETVPRPQNITITFR